MDPEKRLELVLDGTQEVVTRAEIEALLASNESPRAYVGYEPSGFVHIGWLIITRKIRQLIEAGFEVEVLLADWHAFINDKFGGDIDKIQDCGRYFIDCYKAFGLEEDIAEGRIKFRWASELSDIGKYWVVVLRVAKASSLSRIKRAMTIMGRKEHEGDLDSSKFIYPSMQVADIFELGVDLAIGGMDQRHAHMLARDVAEKVGFKKPTALHTPLLSSLSRSGRMEMTTGEASGLDHEMLAKKIEEKLPDLVVDEGISEPTRSLLTNINTLEGGKKRRAIEALFSQKKGLESSMPRFVHDIGPDDSVMNVGTIKELEWRRSEARRELFLFLNVTDADVEMDDVKMSKSNPESGIYLHDAEDDIRRKIKKAWCPEGMPDNPVMEICQLVLFPYEGHLDIRRPEKWGGDMHFESYDDLRKAFADKELHPADLKKSVAEAMVRILDPFRVYFKKNPGNLQKVKKLSSFIGK